VGTQISGPRINIQPQLPTKNRGVGEKGGFSEVLKKQFAKELETAMSRAEQAPDLPPGVYVIPKTLDGPKGFTV